MSAISQQHANDKEWGKHVTIIGNTEDGNVTREDYFWPLQNSKKSQEPDSGNSVCQIRLSNLESQNKQLNDYIQKLKHSFETTQRDLQVCKTDKDVSSEIVPYFYNSDYETSGSSTSINKNNWNIIVWLIGKSPTPNEPLILYPIGEHKLSRFNIAPIQDIVFNLLNENDGPVKGRAFGRTMMSKGAPVIKFSKFENSEGELVDFSTFRLPILFIYG